MAVFESRWLLSAKCSVRLDCPPTHTPLTYWSPWKPAQATSRTGWVECPPVLREKLTAPSPQFVAPSGGSASQSPVVQGHLSVPGCEPLWVALPCVCTVFSTVPEQSEGPGVCLLAGERQASGFQNLFNPWVLTHHVHHQAGSSAHGSDVRGREWPPLALALLRPSCPCGSPCGSLAELTQRKRRPQSLCLLNLNRLLPCN